MPHGSTARQAPALMQAAHLMPLTAWHALYFTTLILSLVHASLAHPLLVLSLDSSLSPVNYHQTLIVGIAPTNQQITRDISGHQAYQALPVVVGTVYGSIPHRVLLDITVL